MCKRCGNSRKPKVVEEREKKEYANELCINAADKLSIFHNSFYALLSHLKTPVRNRRALCLPVGSGTRICVFPGKGKHSELQDLRARHENVS